MIRNKQIPADQLIGLSPDLEGMVQNMHGQKTVGKEIRMINKYKPLRLLKKSLSLRMLLLLL